MGVEKNHETNTSTQRNIIEKYCPPALRKLKESNEIESRKQQTLNKNIAQTSVAATTNSTTQLIENKSECITTAKAQSPSPNSAIVSATSNNNITTTIINNISNNSASSSNSVLTRPARRERRPDREVYVPRARRSQTLIPTNTTTTTNSNISSIPPSTNSNLRNVGLDVSTSNHRKTKESQNNHQNLHHNSIQNKTSKNSFEDRDKRHSISSTTTAISSTNELNTNNKPVINTTSLKNDECDNLTNSLNNFTDEILQPRRQPINIKNLTTKNTTFDIKNKSCDNLDVIQNSVNSTNHIARHNLHPQNLISQNVSEMNKNNKTHYSRGEQQEQQHQDIRTENRSTTALRIEDANTKINRKTDHEAEEFERASKEINRSNRRLIKQTFKSDVLEIPEPTKTTLTDTTPLNNEPSNLNNVDLGEKAKVITIDSDNDDWDSMFDDNGECLNPKLVEELTATVGKVYIETPKTDYSAYLMKQEILSEEEFPHVLEVSNFPVEFKTQDLMMIFSNYKESGFDIKWVDDTHALAVFSSSKIAAEVLAKNHPFVVLKPLAEATYESRAKAKKCSSSLQPYRQRPETCAALARRLVTGALGVRLKTAAQERENEKRVLKEAKERKLLAAKQRDEVWES